MKEGPSDRKIRTRVRAWESPSRAIRTPKRSARPPGDVRADAQAQRSVLSAGGTRDQLSGCRLGRCLNQPVASFRRSRSEPTPSIHHSCNYKDVTFRDEASAQVTKQVTMSDLLTRPTNKTSKRPAGTGSGSVLVVDFGAQYAQLIARRVARSPCLQRNRSPHDLSQVRP